MLVRYRLSGSQPLLLPLLAWFAAAASRRLLGFDPRAGVSFAFSVRRECVALRDRAFLRRPRRRGCDLLAAYLVSGAIAAAVALAMIVLTRTPASQYALQHGRATGTFILPGELAGISDGVAADRLCDDAHRGVRGACAGRGWLAAGRAQSRWC